MNWQEIGAISELIAALGVIISLIYLAAQIRHSIATARATAYQEVYRDLRESLTGAGHDPILKLVRGEELSQEELAGLPRILVVRMRAYENWWVQHRDGILADDVFDAYISHMPNTLSSPIARKWWSETNLKFVPGFEAYVQRFLDRSA